jgi:hypothetical protein
VLSSFGLSESEYFHKRTRPGSKLLAAQQRLTIYFLLDSPPVRDMVESMSEGHGGVRVWETLTGERVFVGNGWKCEKKVGSWKFVGIPAKPVAQGRMTMPLLCKGWLLSRATSFGRTRQQTLCVWSDRN